MRYFVLEKGWIKWYLKEPVSSMKPKGELNLYDYQMHSDIPAGKIRLVLDPGSNIYYFHYFRDFLLVGYESKVKRRLLLYCENYQEKSMWTRSINQHISFQSV